MTDTKTFQRDFSPSTILSPDHIDAFANNVAVASFENGGNETVTLYFSRERLMLPDDQNPDNVKMLRTEFAAISMTKVTAAAVMQALQNSFNDRG